MLETTKQLIPLFAVGSKYTIYRLSPMMATTTKQEIKVVQIDAERGHVVYVLRGKRTPYCLRLESQSYTDGPWEFFEGAMFDGWDQIIKTDVEAASEHGGTFHGNACYNFAGTPEQIRAWIDAGQRNPLFRKSYVLAIAADGAEVVVYPELVVEGQHAVIDRAMPQIA